MSERLQVPSGPWLEWLHSQDRSGWGALLSKTQFRYVNKTLQIRPKTTNIFSVDDILVALDQPHVLSILYPS